jgi:hypothetical protein
MNVNNAGNVVPFITKREVEKEGTIIIDHGVRTLEAVKAVSDYVRELPLSTKQNDSLISLLKDQLLITEHEAFMQGFVACLDEIQGCGLNVAMDKVVKSADINI